MPLSSALPPPDPGFLSGLNQHDGNRDTLKCWAGGSRDQDPTPLERVRAFQPNLLHTNLCLHRPAAGLDHCLLPSSSDALLSTAASSGGGWTTNSMLTAWGWEQLVPPTVASALLRAHSGGGRTSNTIGLGQRMSSKLWWCQPTVWLYCLTHTCPPSPHLSLSLSWHVSCGD